VKTLFFSVLLPVDPRFQRILFVSFFLKLLGVSSPIPRRTSFFFPSATVFASWRSFFFLARNRCAVRLFFFPAEGCGDAVAASRVTDLSSGKIAVFTGRVPSLPPPAPVNAPCNLLLVRDAESCTLFFLFDAPPSLFSTSRSFFFIFLTIQVLLPRFLRRTLRLWGAHPFFWMFSRFISTGKLFFSPAFRSASPPLKRTFFS